MTAGKVVGIAGVALIGLAMFLQVGRGSPRTIQDARPTAEAMRTARAAVASMEKDGAIVARSCDPNTTTIKARMWASLPDDRYRKIAARSLALLCEEQGFERSMVIQSEGRLILGQYFADDSFEGAR